MVIMSLTARPLNFSPPLLSSIFLYALLPILFHSLSLSLLLPFLCKIAFLLHSHFLCIVFLVIVLKCLSIVCISRCPDPSFSRAGRASHSLNARIGLSGDISLLIYLSFEIIREWKIRSPTINAKILVLTR